MAARAEAPSGDKAWFLRALLVLQSPRAVFAALRDDSDDAAEARQDVVGALVWLAGIAAVLATTVAATVRDDVEIDGALFAVWAFLAGGLYGFTLYFAVGKVFHVALRRLGSRGSFRRARHVLAFAATPIALSLVLWPIKLAVYGDALFRSGGSDHTPGMRVFDALELAFLLWAAALLVIGVRAVHGWTWSRAAAACALAVVLPTLVGIALAL